VLEHGSRKKNRAPQRLQFFHLNFVAHARCESRSKIRRSGISRIINSSGVADPARELEGEGRVNSTGITTL
jgi:hypothetical protein